MKWILAQHLEQWAGTQSARADLPGLIGQLIRATVPHIHAFRFPSGDAGQIPGFDGYLESEGVDPYVPAGQSVWEFGTGKDYLKKANDDYAARSISPMSIVPANCCFVFVTPRLWSRRDPALTDWARDKQGEQKWKRVIAMDAVTLEAWLEQCEAVAKQYARAVRGQVWVNQCRTVTEFWEEYAGGFRPELKEEVVLCERNAQADDLIRILAEGKTGVPVRLLADSPDEVIAFAAAAIRKAEPPVRAFLEARTLIVDSADAARERFGSTGLVFLPRDSAISLAGKLSYDAPTVIAHAREQDGVILLPRPSTHAFALALEAMKIEGREAERIAASCGRSVTILARWIPSGTAQGPIWASQHDLVSALLAGGWDTSRDGDKRILGDLAGIPYEDLEERLRPFLRSPEPLEREGSVWNVRAPVEAFTQLGHIITRRDMDRLRAAAVVVFGEVEPALDLPLAERPYAAIHGKKMEHSSWLRDGMAATFLHIAVLHEQAGFKVDGVVPQKFVDDVMDSLPGLRQNARLLISLDGPLRWLAEASPFPLLAALEHLLEGDGQMILPIFEEEGGLFGGSQHTHLLWALESLAWDPEHLARVTLDLARLARIDPGGRLANRPISSLRNILKAWKPETNASLVQRLAAVDCIILNEPTTGWELILALLPVRQDSGIPTRYPRFRDAGASNRESLTQGIVNRTYREIVDRAIGLATGNFSRLLTLTDSMNTFSEPDMQRVCDELEKLLPVNSEEDRVKLWNQLRQSVNMNTAFRDADWAFPVAVLERLRSILQLTQPSDPVLRSSWLFDKHYPDLDNSRGVERVAGIEEARTKAVRELYALSGPSAIIELAKQSVFPGIVAYSFTQLLSDVDSFDQLVTFALSVSAMPESFLTEFSRVAHSRFGAAWEARIRTRVGAGLDPRTTATLLLYWDDEVASWEQAAAFGAQAVHDYWSRRMAVPVRGGIPELERAGREYLKVGRALTAMEVVSEAADKLPADLIFGILDEAIKEIAASPQSVGGNLSYEIGLMFEKLALRQDLSQQDVARREYAYLPILKHRNNHLVLHRLMADDPSFFVSVVCDVFKPASRERRDPTDQERVKALYGYQLLTTFAEVPGFRAGTNLVQLEDWVMSARHAAVSNDRTEITDQFIGQVLAHAPEDPDDGAWPHTIVRELLEKLGSSEIERGMEIGRSNMGGAHFIDPKNPAALERDSARQARAWAQTAATWQRTTGLLESMAKHWDWMADNLEERAKQQAMRE